MSISEPDIDKKLPKISPKAMLEVELKADFDISLARSDRSVSGSDDDNASGFSNIDYSNQLNERKK